MKQMTGDDLRTAVELAARRVLALQDEGKFTEAAALAQRIIDGLAPLAPVAWPCWRLIELAAKLDG